MLGYKSERGHFDSVASALPDYMTSTLLQPAEKVGVKCWTFILAVSDTLFLGSKKIIVRKAAQYGEQNIYAPAKCLLAVCFTELGSKTVFNFISFIFDSETDPDRLVAWDRS